MTKLEAHFLRTVTRAVKNREKLNLNICELYLMFPDSKPGLTLALRRPGEELHYVDVLIYGTRPVRYHFQSHDDTSVATRLWNHCLGALSLVEEKSGVRDGRHHLFYEVTYPDKFLKKLGE